MTVAQGTNVLGATPTFTGGTQDADAEPEARHLHLLLHGPGHRQAGMEGTLKVS